MTTLRNGYLLAAVLLLMAAFASCKKDGNHTSKTGGFSSPEDFIENPSVQSALEESGVPIYEGNDPPPLAGTYLADGEVTDASYELYNAIGAPIQSTIVLSKQTASGKIDFAEMVGDMSVSGSGGYITGNNGRFTIYQESKQSGSEAGLPDEVSMTVVLLMSGKKVSNGDLENVEGISIITEANSSDPSYNMNAVKGLWWKWEADFYLQKENTHAAQSVAEQNNQSLLQKVLQNVMK